jgi:hypothetical protein
MFSDMKLTKQDIDKKFIEVIPEESNYFDYFDGMNLIKLDGRFSSDQLREIARVMDKIHHSSDDTELNRIAKLNVNGFTAKDIKVVYSKNSFCNNGLQFSFYLMKDGKDYDFYYKLDEEGELAGDWWPENEDEFINSLQEFIPRGFAEACENLYEYRGGTEIEAIKCLKKYGFTVEEGEDI